MKQSLGRRFRLLVLQTDFLFWLQSTAEVERVERRICALLSQGGINVGCNS